MRSDSGFMPSAGEYRIRWQDSQFRIVFSRSWDSRGPRSLVRQPVQVPFSTVTTACPCRPTISRLNRPSSTGSSLASSSQLPGEGLLAGQDLVLVLARKMRWSSSNCVLGLVSRISVKSARSFSRDWMRASTSLRGLAMAAFWRSRSSRSRMAAVYWIFWVEFFRAARARSSSFWAWSSSLARAAWLVRASSRPLAEGFHLLDQGLELRVQLGQFGWEGRQIPLDDCKVVVDGLEFEEDRQEAHEVTRILPIGTSAGEERRGHSHSRDNGEAEKY